MDIQSNHQILSEDGLIDRFKSSSFIPGRSSLEYKKFFDTLRHLYRQFSMDGKIRIEYETKIYRGVLS